jgi:cytochrome c551/c552
MKLRHSALVIAAIAASSFAILLHAAAPAPNQALEVDITSPADRSHQPWNSQVAYAVTATYDGKSTKFGELPSNDVVLRATYVADADSQTARRASALPEGLMQISQSNCMGCHDFAASSAGPSFAAIGKRYGAKANATAMLAAHIRSGSSGAWGAGRMPPHPDLSATQATAMAQWIAGFSNDPAVHYSIGKSGSFRMVAPGKAGPHAGLALSAFYTGPLKAGHRRVAAGRPIVIVYGSGS